MKKVTIFSTPADAGTRLYCALAGDKRSTGKTAGEALDSLTMQFADDESETLVIVQNLRSDEFFDADQQKRLAELMDRWRLERDQGKTLTAEEQAELEVLIEDELRASAARTMAAADELAG